MTVPTVHDGVVSQYFRPSGVSWLVSQSDSCLHVQPCTVAVSAGSAPAWLPAADAPTAAQTSSRSAALEPRMISDGVKLVGVDRDGMPARSNNSSTNCCWSTRYMPSAVRRARPRAQPNNWTGRRWGLRSTRPAGACRCARLPAGLSGLRARCSASAQCWAQAVPGS